MDNILKIKNLSLGYNDERLVVKDISLDIEKQSFITILGPNGSGKSTLLKAISKLIKPSRGNIEVLSKDIFSINHNQLAKNMAVVHQENKIDFDFTVKDIVFMGRSPYLGRFEKERPEDIAIVNRAMELTETLGFGDRLINELSGGERQRVMIARSIAQSPSILLLDEPTSHLDIHHQIEILELLKKLNQEDGITIVLVLHDINLAARYSKKIAIMKDGQLVRYGPTREVITKDILRDVYEMEMSIEEKALGGHINIVPLYTTKSSSIDKESKHLHLICGGGSGWELVVELKKQGYGLSAGVLNIGDSDHRIIKELSIPVVEEEPFSPISTRAHLKNIELIDKCDEVIISPIPVGMGNLKNLEAALYALDRGKPLYIFGKWQGNYDFTGGRATEIIDQIYKKGGKTISNLKEIDRPC